MGAAYENHPPGQEPSPSHPFALLGADGSRAVASIDNSGNLHLYGRAPVWGWTLEADSISRTRIDLSWSDRAPSGNLGPSAERVVLSR
jgi:hypothetical protein